MDHHTHGGAENERGRHGRCGHPGGPRKSVLDTRHYETMDVEDKLTALFRETGNWMRFYMEEKGSQNRVLRILFVDGPMTQKALTERIGIQPGSASEVLGKLEKSGFIARSTSESDRRTVDVMLTETGTAEAKRQLNRRKAQKARLFTALSGEEKAALLTTLETLSRDWQSKAAGGARDGSRDAE